MAIATAMAATIRLFSSVDQMASSLNRMRYHKSVQLRGGKPPTPVPLKE